MRYSCKNVLHCIFFSPSFLTEQDFLPCFNDSYTEGSNASLAVSGHFYANGLIFFNKGFHLVSFGIVVHLLGINSSQFS